MAFTSLLFSGQVIAQTKVPNSLPSLESSEFSSSKAGTLIQFADNLVEPPERPDFDAEVLVPLREAQAKRAAELAAEGKARQDALEAAQRVAAQKASQAQAAAQNESRKPIAVQVSTQLPLDIVSIITHWATTFGISPAWAISIARCESTLNPMASNGTHFGLFQFNPRTYAAYYTAAGAGSDYWDANNNARVATYMLSRGMASQWECKG